MRTLLNVSSSFIRHPSVFLEKKNYLLMIGHMRGYTTLIAHILGSHPEITGYTENHIPYRNFVDLMRIRHRVGSLHGGHLPGRFVFDKLLHNFEISDWAIQNQSIRFFITIREPIATLESIYRMKEKLSDGVTPDMEGDILPNYIRRLDGIVDLAKRLKGNYFFMKGEDLVEDAEATLAALTQWIGLDTALKPEYQIFDQTGTAGFGDYSANIQSGEILKARTQSSPLVISETLKALAIEKYQTVLRQLSAGQKFSDSI
ncbi:sulfotransferase [Coraliomargarita algicola]|uniref:Sulfotransferase n=1 Tax=Coraliomargarita algicola TaxID=3092156 RepID=A0ABZ0RRC9_9BACT|nr:sulfotransferase [Coraliomargarita sp. J2-16]WPJ97723.1 sulfotransferase [Coraliomargarita sp. J2-16]